MTFAHNIKFAILATTVSIANLSSALNTQRRRTSGVLPDDGEYRKAKKVAHKCRHCLYSGWFKPSKVANKTLIQHYKAKSRMLIRGLQSAKEYVLDVWYASTVSCRKRGRSVVSARPDISAHWWYPPSSKAPTIIPEHHENNMPILPSQ